MMLRLLLIVVSVGLVACLKTEFLAKFVKSPVNPEGKIWAVLVAGSNDWKNYRHQADVCHAYQILHQHGIPDERIVVMMYDDISFNERNPTPGMIINRPYGKNVYQGIPRDYTGDDVTPDNFLNALQGNEEKMRNIGSGKVIKSGPNDHVFLYYSDHGAQGLISFPEKSTGEEQFLMARRLMGVLKKMHAEDKFNKMVIYIEACESGSMFHNLLPDNINIYATTAANSTESSYAAYWDSERFTFLGDLYSVSWMEDSDLENLTAETVHRQYEIVKQETAKSHVQEYGDLSIAKLSLSEFQGRKESPPFSYKPIPKDAVPSRDVPLEILKRKMKVASREKQREINKELKKLEKNRAFADQVVENIVRRVARNSAEAHHILTTKQEIKNFDCYEDLVHHFHRECFHLNKNEYMFGKLYVLVNMCENDLPVYAIKNAMNETCTHKPVYGII